MRLALVGLTLAAMLPAARAAHAGACATQGWHAEVLTKPGQVIASSGGIIAGIRPGMADAPSSENPAIAKWVLRSGGKTIPLKAESLAPGLARYRPTRRAAARAWNVQPRRAADTQALGPDIRVSFAKAAARALAAPSLASVHSFRRKLSPMGPRRGTRTVEIVTVRLAKPAPPNALGLILYDGTTATGAPMLFRRTGAGLRDVVMFSTPGRCQPHLAAWRRPSAGQLVTAAWIDETGTLSPRSAAKATSDVDPLAWATTGPGAPPYAPRARRD